MLLLRACSCGLLLPLLLSTGATSAPGDLTATPQRVELSIGSSKHRPTEGVASGITVNRREAPVRVALREAKSLQVDDFSFTYPSGFTHHSSSADGDSRSASWMLKGQTCQITVHRKDKATTLAYLVDHMAAFYQGLSEVSSFSRQPITMTVQGSRVAGTRFTMQTRSEGETIQDYFQLPARSARYNYFLVIHGKPDDPSQEQARNLIGGTFK